jgi:hypothetical protein
MGKAKRKVDPEVWTEKHGCDGRPPIKVEGITDLKGRARVDRNTNHCTLCRLHHLGYLKDRVSDNSHDAVAISDMRHRAGEKLQDDHAASGLSTIKGTPSSLEGGGSACGPAEIAQMKIDASRRLESALNAVGTSARYLLQSMVLEDKSAAQVASILRIDKNGVMPCLRVSLDALAANYGMDQTAKTKIRGGAAQPIDPFHPFQDYC